MRNLKEKLNILKSLETGIFDPARISEYLSYAVTPEMTVPILRNIVHFLIECDSNISASYEMISDEEWDTIVSDNPILDDNNMDLKTKVDCLTMHFFSVYAVLEQNAINTVLEILTELFKVKTKNVQFLLFLIAKNHPKQVFAYLIARMKKSPTIFAPFFSSLLVRLPTDSELKEKCFSALKKHIKAQIPSKNVNYLITIQSYFYILCFKQFPIDKESVEIFDLAYHKGLIPLLNKNVMQKLCTDAVIIEKKYKDIIFSPLENSCFNLFPFDLPIIPAIKEKVASEYIDFE